MANRVKIKENTFGVGDVVRVHSKIKEGGKERVVVFEGMVIAISGREENKTFTVRRIGAGKVGIEMIWPVFSPRIEKVEVKSRPAKRPRRAKLYHIRIRKK